MLGHYIEEEGVPTAGISLIRPHTEKIKPPRSLWVTFELGRPLGSPNDADFQERVLMDLLKLFEVSAGPVLMDYPDDAPGGSEDSTVLACPVHFAQDTDLLEGIDQMQAAFLREITAMRPLYDMSVAKRHRTTVGVSGLAIDYLGDFIYGFVKGEEPENPREDVTIDYTLKLAVEDLKAYYMEGITSQPGQTGTSSQTLADWFWKETVAGKVLLELKKVCQESQNEMISRMGGHFVVPMEVESHDPN